MFSVRHGIRKVPVMYSTHVIYNGKRSSVMKCIIKESLSNPNQMFKLVVEVGMNLG